MNEEHQVPMIEEKPPRDDKPIVPFPSARIAFQRKCPICKGVITRPKRGPIPMTCSDRCRKAKSRQK